MTIKDLTAFTAIIVIATAIVGCGGGDPAPVAAPPPPPPPPRIVAAGGGKKPATATNAPAARVNRPTKDEAEIPPPPKGDPADLYQVLDTKTSYVVTSRLLDTTPPPEKMYLTEIPAADVPPEKFFVSERPEQSGAMREDLQAPPGFSPLPEFGFTSGGLPLKIRCTADGSVMALIPAGPFAFGVAEQGDDVGPPVAIEMPTYYIDVTEITIQQYEQFREYMQNKGKTVPTIPGESGDPNLPVTGLTWGQAQAYARATGKELPTEAEWEKAARGSDGFDHPWGNGRPFWGEVRSHSRIAPVGSYASDRSPYGVLDMAGNAAEWTADWYSPNSHDQAAAANENLRKAWSGPRNPSETGIRTVKGDDPDWNVWGRRGADMRNPSPRIGFRCILRTNPPTQNTTAAVGD